MADKTYEIQLVTKADNSGAESAKGKIRELTGETDKFIESLKMGVGIDLGGRLVNSLGALPGVFQQAIRRGVEFNATMTGAEHGIANVIAKFQQLDAVAAKNEAAKAMAKIAEVEPQSAAGLGDLVQGFMATFAASQSAGISIEQNVELVGAFANALANANIPAEQLSQELRSIFTGNITADSALAKNLSISNQDVARAREAGNLYGFLKDQIGQLGESGDTFQVRWSTLQSTIDKSLATISRPVFDAIFESLRSLNDELQKPEITEGLKQIGYDVAVLVHNGAALTQWAIRHADTLGAAARAVGMFGVAWAALKLKDLIVGLGLMTVQWTRGTVAIGAQTVALAANTRAKEANAVAGARAAAAGGAARGGALASLLGNVNLAALAGAAGWAGGRFIDDRTGISEKAAEAMSPTTKANPELMGRMAQVEAQIKLADTVEKKLEAEVALRRLLTELQERALQASAGEKKNLEANLRYFLNIRDHLSTIEGSAVKAAEAQKKSADDAARQADALAAANARAELDYQIGQARAGNNAALVAQLKEQKQLEEDIATLRKNYGDAGMTPETARAIAKEFQAARQAAEDLKRAEETGQMRHALSEAGLDNGLKRAQQLQNLYEDYYRQTRLNRAELPMDDANQMFDVAQAAQSKEGMETAIKIKELKKEIADEDARHKAEQQKTAKEWQALHDATLAAQRVELEIEYQRISGHEEEARKLEIVRDYWQEVAALMSKGLTDTEAQTIATQKLNNEMAKIAPAAAAPQPQQTDFDDGRIHVRGHRGISGEYIVNPADSAGPGRASPQYTPTDFSAALRQKGPLARGIVAHTPGLDAFKWKSATDQIGSAVVAPVGGSGPSPATAHDDLKGAGESIGTGSEELQKGAQQMIQAVGVFKTSSQSLLSIMQDYGTRLAALERQSNISRNNFLDSGGQAT